jgi:hypothetical protein
VGDKHSNFCRLSHEEKSFFNTDICRQCYQRISSWLTNKLERFFKASPFWLFQYLQVRSSACHYNHMDIFDQPGANTLAYLYRDFARKKKSFIAFPPGRCQRHLCRLFSSCRCSGKSLSFQRFMRNTYCFV